MNIPSALAHRLVVGRQVAMKVMLDLTLYLMEPTELEFEYLINLYEALCPRDRLLKFKIAEISDMVQHCQPYVNEACPGSSEGGSEAPLFRASP